MMLRSRAKRIPKPPMRLQLRHALNFRRHCCRHQGGQSRRSCGAPKAEPPNARPSRSYANSLES